MTESIVEGANETSLRNVYHGVNFDVKMNDLEKDEPKVQTTQNVQNNMFVGSTADLLKALKESK